MDDSRRLIDGGETDSLGLMAGSVSRAELGWQYASGKLEGGRLGLCCVDISAEKSSYMNVNKQWLLLERNKAPKRAEAERVIVPSLSLSRSVRSDQTIRRRRFDLCHFLDLFIHKRPSYVLNVSRFVQ